jgi:5-methylcytosine-specific restriction endonuclease McrA
MAPARQPATLRTADNRMTGRRLQSRRLRVWAEADGLCAACAGLTAYPHGFELDHKVALLNGGADTDENCQVLCHDCHARKTASDLGRAPPC